MTALGEALAAVGPLAERSRRVVDEAAFASRAHGRAVQKKRADPWGTEAWLLVIRAVEGGAFADFGIAALFPGGCSVYDELARLAVRERAEAITGAPGRPRRRDLLAPLRLEAPMTRRKTHGQRTNPGPHGRKQADVLVRAFEADVLVRFFRTWGTSTEDPRRQAFEDEALAAVEDLLGEPVLPQALRTVRQELCRDPLGRPPSYGGPDDPHDLLPVARHVRRLEGTEASRGDAPEGGPRRRSQEKPWTLGSDLSYNEITNPEPEAEDGTEDDPE